MWKTDKQIEKERKCREKKDGKNLKRKLERSFQPGGGKGGRAYGFLNRKDGFLVKEGEPRSQSSSTVKQKRTSNQKKTTKEICDGIAETVSGESGDLRMDEIVNETTVQSFRKDVLKKKFLEIRDLARMENELFENSSDDEVQQQQNSKTWTERMEDCEAGWKLNREAYFRAYVSYRVNFSNRVCSHCKFPMLEFGIRCKTCHGTFCHACDVTLHYGSPFHCRDLLRDCHLRPLKPNEFCDLDGKITDKDVPVPLFVPSCNECGFGEMCLTPGTKVIAVVTRDGRFDLKSTVFQCTRCNAKHEATVENYIQSGYWPGTTASITFLYQVELLEFWNHLKHQCPGSSERKYLQILEEITKSRGRYNVISRVHFARASREYEYIQHRIRTEVCQDVIGFCSACGKCPLAIHLDGNFKLYRWGRASKQQMDISLFADSIISSDAEVERHISLINTVKPSVKEKDSCGGSTYTAGRSDSRKKKNLDETGLIMGSCRHGVILGAVNMHKGESYRHVHYLHSKLPSSFLCQDVVCHYWPFAVDVGELLPNFANVTQHCKPFLSRWHGKTHSWSCQILWSGHWKEGAAGTLGEEQEQSNATMSRYSSSTRHMSTSARRDHLSSGIAYWNRRKLDKMQTLLLQRMSHAQKKVVILNKEFNEMLINRGLKEENLPEILDNLRTRAIHGNDRTASKNFPLAFEREDLEGLYVQVKRLQRRIQTVAVSSKERIKMRANITSCKKRAFEIIKLMNGCIKECKERMMRNEGIEGDLEMDKWEQIESENFEEGTFPWVTDGIVPFREDFDLIDTWMLLKRFEEEIVEVPKEMLKLLEFLKEKKEFLENTIRGLENHVSSLDSNGEEFLMCRGKISILSTEVVHTKKELLLSLSTFENFLSDSEFESKSLFTDDENSLSETDKDFSDMSEEDESDV